MARLPSAAKRRRKTKKKDLKMLHFDIETTTPFNWDVYIEEKHRELLTATKRLLDQKVHLMVGSRSTGKSMMEMDYSQVESRVLRHIEEEPVIVDVEAQPDEEPVEGMVKGSRVYLVNRSMYRPGEHNPVKGTEYECMGTIDHISDYTQHCVVKWDNGKQNTYMITKDLVLAEIAQNCKSIW